MHKRAAMCRCAIGRVALLILTECLLVESSDIIRSVCDSKLWTVVQPIVKHRYFIQSPAFDGISKYKRNTQCHKGFSLVLTASTPVLCCRLIPRHFDLNAEHSLTVLYLKDIPANRYDTYYKYSIAMTLSLVPNKKYTFSFETDNQDPATGFNLELRCNWCKSDKLEGVAMFGKPTYPLSAFVNGQEQYIQSYEFGGFVQRTRPKNHPECSLKIQIKPGVCCNLVNVWFHLFYDQSVNKSQGVLDIAFRPFNKTNEPYGSRIPIDSSSLIYTHYDYFKQNREFKVKYTPTDRVDEQGCGFHLHLMCVWCDDSRNVLPTDAPKPTTSSTNIICSTNSHATKDSQKSALLDTVIFLATVLFILLIVLTVYGIILHKRVGSACANAECALREALPPTLTPADDNDNGQPNHVAPPRVTAKPKSSKRRKK